MSAAMRLQRSIGNRALGHLVETGLLVGPPGDHYDQEPEGVAEEFLGMRFEPHQLSETEANALQRAGAGSKGPAIAHEVSRSPVAQSLTINQPGDHYEQEADRVAEQVTSGSVALPGGLSNLTGSVGPLQRECSCGGTCASCQEEEDRLQRKAESSAAPQQHAGAAPEIVHEVLRSAGQPLDHSTRAYFERGFGRNFSGVRVHIDSRAVESARAVNALAYTLGSEIAFASGKYAPTTHEGQRLLAHELAHVVQQRASTNAASVVQRQSLPASKREPEALNPQRKLRPPIPDEIKAEMIRQIIAIRDRWSHRLLPLKVSDVELVVNLVWEYSTKGRDASRGGRGSPSDWVDTLIELMSQTTYDRRAVRTNWVNLWDDALENATPIQRAEINRYLTQSTSQYVSYKPPDRSTDPSFLADVVKPVVDKAMQLGTLGIFDLELLKQLRIAATDRNMEAAEAALRKAGELLETRLINALTLGGGPAAYANVQFYRAQHPDGGNLLELFLIAGEGFVAGISENLLPIPEKKILLAENPFEKATFWEKMEAFFSAVLKVISLGRMAKSAATALKGGGTGRSGITAREAGLGKQVSLPEGGSREPAPPASAPKTPELAPPAKMPVPEGFKTVAATPSAKPAFKPASQIKGMIAAFALGVERTRRTVLSTSTGTGPPVSAIEPRPAARAELPPETVKPGGLEHEQGTPQTPPHAESPPETVKPSGLEHEQATPQTPPHAELPPERDIFREIHQEMALETPGTVTYPSTAAAAAAATALGLHSPDRPGFQTHSTAPSVRRVLGRSGNQWQSVHMLMQAAYRALRARGYVPPGGQAYSPGRALTTVDLSLAAHRAFDAGWVPLWNAAVASGQRISAGQVYQWLSNAINSVSPNLISNHMQGIILARIRTELFVELGLNWNDPILP
jgi:hypothetical protein